MTGERHSLYNGLRADCWLRHPPHHRPPSRRAAGPRGILPALGAWPVVLAATEFTGFKLVQFAGRLQLLDLAPGVSGALLTFRLLILGVAVAATWLSVLAPGHRWHFGYRLSGWYIVVLAAVALALGLAKSGIEVPPLGFALWFAGAAFFLVAEFGRSKPP